MTETPADGPVDREEFEQLRRRVQRLEAELARLRPPPPVETPSAPPPRPSMPLPPTATPSPTYERPSPPSPAPAPRPAMTMPKLSGLSVETLLGQRFAPRVGALLVFLAALFFLGLGIQRGWIGPVAQLLLAAVVGLGLAGGGVFLWRRGGFGHYPEILAATGACILYVDAFVAHALPYYERVTGLSELGSGLLMALVAAGTIGLALGLDARRIAGLGYTLAFLTAGFGWDVLPEVTVTYVALLGASLAAVVWWKRWLPEAVVGSVLTGGLLLLIAVLSTFSLYANAPPDWAIALAGLLPAAAFLALSLRPARRKMDAALGAVLGLVTLTWAVILSFMPLPPGPVPAGVGLFAWTALAGSLAWVAHRGGQRLAMASYGVAAALLYVAGAHLVWTDAPEPEFLTTATCVLGAFAVGLFARRSVFVWGAAVGLAFVAMARAVFLDGRLDAPFFAEGLLGEWTAFVTFALVVPVLALLVAQAPAGQRDARVALFGVAVAFAGAWAFALFRDPLLTTLHLLALGGLLAALGRWRRMDLATESVVAGGILVGVAALKVAALDVRVEPRMDLPVALLETLLVAGALLALHHAGGARRLAADVRRLVGAVLVGGSALTLLSWVFEYLQGAWISVVAGVLGVAYLVSGFAMRTHSVYRFTGFGILGLVLLRIFLVDLSETDLAVRAGVFALLGAILLGIGYVYARANRTPPKPPAPAEEPPVR